MKDQIYCQQLIIEIWVYVCTEEWSARALLYQSLFILYSLLSEQSDKHQVVCFTTRQCLQSYLTEEKEANVFWPLCNLPYHWFTVCMALNYSILHFYISLLLARTNIFYCTFLFVCQTLVRGSTDSYYWTQVVHLLKRNKWILIYHPAVFAFIMLHNWNHFWSTLPWWQLCVLQALYFITNEFYKKYFFKHVFCLWSKNHNSCFFLYLAILLLHIFFYFFNFILN